MSPPLDIVETTSPPRRSWRFRAGALLFVVLTWLLGLAFCEHGARACQGDESVVSTVVVLVAVVELGLLLALFTGQGRRFALGFLSLACVTLLFVARGWPQLWTLPARAGVEALRPVWGPYAAATEQAARASAWAGARRAELPTVIHAQRLANALHECAARFRAVDSLASFPRGDAQLVQPMYCAELAATRLDAPPDAQRFTEADYGWRWSYLPGPPDSAGRVGSYTVRVFQDPAIGRDDPRYEGDESGVVREIAAGKPPAIVATPVPLLVQLRTCLTRVPAEHEKRAATYGWDRRPMLLYEVSDVCPELRGHYGLASTDGRDKGLLSISARGTPGEFIDTVAVYTVELIQADDAGIVFELRATPAGGRNSFVHSGVRRFFVARDGSIHVTTGQGAAIESDALVAECMEAPHIGCGEVPVTPRQLPGS